MANDRSRNCSGSDCSIRNPSVEQHSLKGDAMGIPKNHCDYGAHDGDGKSNQVTAVPASTVAEPWVRKPGHYAAGANGTADTYQRSQPRPGAERVTSDQSINR
jgi:hypothetical protein